MNEQRVPIDRRTWERFLQEVKELAKSETGGKAKGLAAALLALLVGVSLLNVVSSYVGRDFMTAIEHHDMPGFMAQALLYLLVFAASTLVAVIYRYCEERLALLGREWLTRRLIARYTEPPTYYRLNDQLVENGEIANPDQRIAEDVRAFSTTILSFALMVLNGIITVLAFSGVMWSISPLLFGVAVTYAALGSYLTIALGRPLVRLNFSQFDKEANFRSDLIHVRKNAESIALLSREGRIRARLLHRLEALVENFKQIIVVNRNLGFFTTGYNFLIQIIPALVVAPMFIRGEVEFGVITQSTMAFIHLLGAFSLIVTQFQSISSFTAVIARLNSLMEAIEQSREHAGTVEVEDAEGAIEYQGLTLTARTQVQPLIQNLSFKIDQGQRLLVLGPSHDAKVALLRATAGIWAKGEGRIRRPGAGQTLFLPERPYMPPVTLREALLRSGREATVKDEQIIDLLKELNLEGVLERTGGLDAEQDWDNILSLGEQQMLAAARLILAGPAFVFLDRISTALSPEDVGLLLGLLNNRGITYITLGHSRFGRRGADDKLADYDIILELAGDGGWTLKEIRDGHQLVEVGGAPSTPPTSVQPAL
jgi:putative ATP-binding cassette transporter